VARSRREHRGDYRHPGMNVLTYACFGSNDGGKRATSWSCFVNSLQRASLMHPSRLRGNSVWSISETAYHARRRNERIHPQNQRANFRRIGDEVFPTLLRAATIARTSSG